MPFYTIIADYEGGTYVSQHTSANAKAAVLQWAAKGSFLIDQLKLSGKQLQRLRYEFTEGDPTPLNDTRAVWIESAILKRKFLYITIVQTDCGHLAS